MNTQFPLEPISLNEFHDIMYEHVVPLNELSDYQDEPLRKTIPTWRKHGLLPFLPEGAWARISFAQLFWLRVLDTLRQFGYPMKWMHSAAEYFFKDAYDDNLPERNIRQHVDTLKKKDEPDMEERELLVKLQEALRDKEFLYGLKWSINYLTYLITNFLLKGVDCGILFFAEGEVVEKRGDEYHSHRTHETDATLRARLEPHIYISLVDYLRGLIGDEPLSQLLVPQILNTEEKMVLKAVRDKNLKELHITLLDGEIKSIKATSHHTVTKQHARMIKETLGMKSYQNLTLKTVDGKSLFIKREQKLK